MTAPTPSDPQTDFNNDLGALNAAAADYAAAEAEQAAADKIYQEQVLTKLDSLKDAFQILAFLIYFVFQNTEPPTNPTQADACIFGLMGNQVGIKGKALAVNSLLTKVHNDLQKLVDSNDTTTTDVKNVASDLDKLLKDFQSNPNLKQAIDPTTFQQMQDTDLTIRHQFFINGDTSGFNPPENSDPTKNGYTYHFTDGTESFYLHSFGEMQNNMKTPGDTNEANEAFKTLTDNFNSNTGMTQTVNSAINEEINQITNFIKTLLGFYENALLQPWTKLANVAIQNQSKAS